MPQVVQAHIGDARCYPDQFPGFFEIGPVSGLTLGREHPFSILVGLLTHIGEKTAGCLRQRDPMGCPLLGRGARFNPNLRRKVDVLPVRGQQFTAPRAC